MSHSGNAEATVAVVIPYYQREPGILRRALESVEAQVLPDGATLHCVIVDDGSPHPADGELPSMDASGRVMFSVVRQANGGVSAARNAALENLPGDTAFVACLDSDDLWAPDHVASALSAMAEGADFYFADSLVEDDVRWFSTIAEFEQLLDRQGGGRDVAFFAANELLPAFVLDCPAHTSGVFYRLSSFRDHRFDLTLRSAGEDHLFWFDLVKQSGRIAVNRRTTSSRGHGVDLYRSAQSWDSPGCLARLCGNLAKQLRIASMAEDRELREKCRTQIDRVRQELLVVMLRAIVVYPKRVASAVAFLWRHDRRFFSLMWQNGIAVWRRKRLTGSFI